MPAKLIDFFSGWENYNDLIVQAVKPLDQDQLAWAPAPTMWPVARLANHIVAARAWWFGGWMNEETETLNTLINYDDEPGADQREAAQIVDALNLTWGALCECLRRWTEADLDASFQRPIPNAKGERPWRTRRYIVWHVAEHDLHHGGEISLILGMHGGRGLDL